MKQIHTHLRRIRREANLTQVQLAEKIGVDQTTISAVEVGRSPTTTEVLERWVEACEGRYEIYAKGESPFDGASPSLVSEAMDVARDYIRASPRVRRAIRAMVEPEDT